MRQNLEKLIDVEVVCCFAYCLWNIKTCFLHFESHGYHIVQYVMFELSLYLYFVKILVEKCLLISVDLLKCEVFSKWVLVPPLLLVLAC
uniref:Putative ovule protein n=1 Tax=Solanum chacoense TaxID=4108 RepID=A0A0V0IEL8_SOLCH